MTLARNGKALAVAGANNSVQVINGQALLQWTEEKAATNDLAGLPGTMRVITSVTRLGDLLDFGQLFKAFGNN